MYFESGWARKTRRRRKRLLLVDCMYEFMHNGCGHSDDDSEARSEGGGGATLVGMKCTDWDRLTWCIPKYGVGFD